MIADISPARRAISYPQIMPLPPGSRPPEQSKPARTGSGSPRLGTFGELALLRMIRLRAAHSQSPELQLGIGDDCAILRPAPGEELAVTTDLSIAGRHFRLDWHPAESIGHRALARGLSDLAAMGARPVGAFLSLALPADLVQNPKARSASTRHNSPQGPHAERTKQTIWLDRFLDGFFALAQSHQLPLAGGDLSESPLAVADVVLTGAVSQGRALLRSGAKPGDLIYVTGQLGGAAVGLEHLTALAAALKRERSRQKASPIPPRLKALLNRHLFPTPRVAQGLWLARNSLATAAIDLSDGVSPTSPTSAPNPVSPPNLTALPCPSPLPQHPLKFSTAEKTTNSSSPRQPPPASHRALKAFPSRRLAALLPRARGPQARKMRLKVQRANGPQGPPVHPSPHPSL